MVSWPRASAAPFPLLTFDKIASLCETLYERHFYGTYILHFTILTINNTTVVFVRTCDVEAKRDHILHCFGVLHGMNQ
jgi:hypothetical protein